MPTATATSSEATIVKGEEDPIAAATKVLESLSQPEVGVDLNMTQGLVVAQSGVVTTEVEQTAAADGGYGDRITALSVPDDGVNSYFHPSFDDMSQSGYQPYRMQNSPRYDS